MHKRNSTMHMVTDADTSHSQELSVLVIYLYTYLCLRNYSWTRVGVA